MNDKSPLTERQTEVLALVAKGMRNAEIATLLGVSHKTVEQHSFQTLPRLGASNRAEAVAIAVRAGWI